MAGRGPAPKGTRSRERDQKRIDAETTVVEADGEVRGPDLPTSFQVFDGEQFVEAEWPEATATWWETWRTSPQAKMFTDTDWSFLLDTAVLHAEFWLGDRKVAPELRLRVAKFGATPDDRARLKIAATGPGGEGGSSKPAAKRPAVKARKTRLLKVVGGDGAEEA